jgi:hypothetical protein
MLVYSDKKFPPSSFNLLLPADGDTVNGLVTLDWEDAVDTEQITYDIRYSIHPDFEPVNEVNGLTVSTYTFPINVLTDFTTYYWKVVATDGFEETWSGPEGYWSFTVGYEGNLPTGFALYTAVPNPNDGSAVIGFALPRTCSIDVSLYDIKGRKVSTLAEGEFAPGEYEIPVSGLSSGVYLYKLETDEFTGVKKMVVR